MMQAIGWYSSAKNDLGTALAASEDLLHVHAGLLLFFAAALLLRRRMRSRVPVGVVWAFALANEAIDAFSPAGRAGTSAILADIVNTVFWPTLLFLIARRPGTGDPNKTA